MKKFYVVNGEYVSATDAMNAHRNGQPVDVATVAFSSDCWDLIKLITVPGMDQAERNAEKENRLHCKHLALEVEAYAKGNVYRCPGCGEEIRMRDDVGDKYKCPHCKEVNDVNDYDQLSVWDFLSDVFDIEYRMGSKQEYRSVRIMVACGGPNIYIDTASKEVELYWWNERANYPLDYDACDLIDQWAEDVWNC